MSALRGRPEVIAQRLKRREETSADLGGRLLRGWSVLSFSSEPPRLKSLAGLSGLGLGSKATWAYDGEFPEACRSEFSFDQLDLQLAPIAVVEEAER